MFVLPLLVNALPALTTTRLRFDLTNKDFVASKLLRAFLYCSYANGGNWSERIDYRARIDDNGLPNNYPLLTPSDADHGTVILQDAASGGPEAYVSPLLALYPQFEIQYTHTGPAAPEPALNVSLVIFAHRSA